MAGARARVVHGWAPVPRCLLAEPDIKEYSNRAALNSARIPPEYRGWETLGGRSNAFRY
jgi:hypothetical protein